MFYTQRRAIRYFFYKLRHGFSPAETWSLDYTISSFIIPRLKYFANNLWGYPADLTEEEWDVILGKMILAFETHKATQETDCCLADENEAKIVKDGMDLFVKYYMNLWD